MKRLVLVAATAAGLIGGLPFIGTSPAAAQRVGVEIREHGDRDRDFRDYRDHCRMVTVTRWRGGVRVTRTERRCGPDRD